jgi:MFS family permease
MTPQHDVGLSLRREANRLHRRLLAAAVFLIALCMGGLWLVTYASFGDDGGSDPTRAAAIGAAVNPFVRAAVEAQTPADRTAALQDVLAAAIDTYSELVAIAVLSAEGNRIAYLHRDRAAPALLTHADVFVSGGATEKPAHLLRVSVDRSRATSFLTSLWDLALALLAMTLAVHIFLRCLTEWSIRAPLALFDRVGSAIEHHDWSVGAEPVGPPELRRVLIRLNGAVRQINERRARLHWLAREIAMGDVAAHDRGQDIIERYAGTAQHAPDQWAREAAPQGIAVTAALLFAGFFADQLAAWLVPLAIGAGGRGLDRLDALAAASPAAAYVVMLGVGSVLARRLLEHLSPRQMFASGCAAGALGLLVFVFSNSLAMLCWGRALSGLGGAAMLIACLGNLSPRPGAFAKLVSAIAAAAVCGTAAGALLSEGLQDRQIFAIAAAMSLVVALFGLIVLARCRRTGAPALPARAPLWALALITIACAYAVGPVALKVAGLEHMAIGRVFVVFGMAWFAASTAAGASPVHAHLPLALSCFGGCGLLALALLPGTAGIVTAFGAFGLVAGLAVAACAPDPAWPAENRYRNAA